LVRQVFTESLLLSVAGGFFGIWLAYFGAEALVRVMVAGLRVPGIPTGIRIQVVPDERVLLFTLAVTVFTGVFFGLAPAWNAFFSVPAPTLREFGRVNETRFRRFFGKSLIVVQVAFSVVLLSAATLFVRRLSKLEHLDLGFQRDHILLVRLDPQKSGYKPEQLIRPYQELLSRLRAIPGVRSATLCGASPISGAGASRFITVQSHPERPEDRRYISLNWVAPKYFETLGTAFLAGRDFNFADQGRSRVAIINQAAAHYYFGNGSPLGRYFAFEGNNQPIEIVGMVANAKYYDIREVPKRTIYLDAFQDWYAPSQFVLRTSVKPLAVVGEARTAIRIVLHSVPVTDVTTLSDQVDGSILPERLIAALSGLFGVIGSILVSIGLYGLLAYTFARRINEIGIRMALGASQASVLWLVFQDALAMVCTGLVLGVPLALSARSFASSLIEDVQSPSGAPIFYAIVFMFTVTLLATYWPARRASRIDPMEALRFE
jgi:predicted permease